MDPLFPASLDDLSGKSDAELSELLAQSEEVLNKVADRDADTLGERTHEDILAETARGVADIERVRGELKAREAAAAEAEAKLNELVEKGRAAVAPEEAEEAAEEEETPEPVTAEETPDEVVAEEQVEEPVTAAAKPPARSVTTRPRLRVQKPEADHAPLPDTRGHVTITASADVPGFAMGQRLNGRDDIAKAMIERKRHLGGSTVSGERIPVVRIQTDVPEERQLYTETHVAETMAKVKHAVGDAPFGRKDSAALVASGGLCAPVQVYYDLEVLARADRPVRNSLTNFNAQRGGIRFAPPPTLASITTAVTLITNDEAAGSGAPSKTCQSITCPEFQEVDVSSISSCLTFDNLNSRAYPEQVAAATELTAAAWARVAEVQLLDGIKDASTKATVNLTPDSDSPLGANAILLPAILRAAVALRNRHRMDPEAVLDLRLPAFALDLLTSDIIRSAFDRFSANDASIEATLRSYGLRVSYYIDGSTDGAQMFGAQTPDSTLLEFPPTVEFQIAPPGSFLFLDSGSLDLGLVRDSVLNATNDYQIFQESWENVAFVGVESLWVTANVCDTGAVAAAVDSVCGS